ncbi:MAG: bifunctional oligoribonuclease/PAP phosphatase NrnA [Ruminococcus sp.]|nr:bifunctional oligoribonuclease/PAP phosphatase NrnA [Ruminococcus sp.]
MDFDRLHQFFKDHDNYILLTHKAPDGDTLGTAFALYAFLKELGKKARVVNSEPFPERYSFLYEGYQEEQFEAQTVVALDIATEQLLGSNLEEYKGKVDLCIDHHISNSYYAKESYVDGTASAAALVLYDFFKDQGIELSDMQAKCLYTAIATDTGCFKFENTTPEAHIAAAELMQRDISFSIINRKMFDTKSCERLAVEQAVISKMEYFFGGRCAVICLTKELMENSGVEPAEFDGLANIPMTVDSVQIGITIKQRHERVFKLSVRTTESYDACKFCSFFGGGGHIRAAGCEIEGTLEEVKKKVLAEVEGFLGRTSCAE